MKLKTLKARMFLSFYEWISEQETKVFILIDNGRLKNDLLNRYQSEIGLVTLNVGFNAIGRITISDEFVEVDTAFSGVAVTLKIDFDCLLGIYFPLEKDGLKKMFLLPANNNFDFEGREYNVEHTQPVKITKIEESAKLAIVPSDEPTKNNVTNMFEFKNRK